MNVFTCGTNYSHINFLGYYFRYGLVFSLIIYITFVIMIIKYWKPTNALFLIFIGIFIGSFFGAGLIIDPTSWLFIGLMLSLYIKKSKLIISK